MILTLKEKFLQNHETSPVIINSKNSHSNRKFISHLMFIHHQSHFLLIQKSKNPKTESMKQNKNKVILKEDFMLTRQRMRKLRKVRES